MSCTLFVETEHKSILEPKNRVYVYICVFVSTSTHTVLFFFRCHRAACKELWWSTFSFCRSESSKRVSDFPLVLKFILKKFPWIFWSYSLNNPEFYNTIILAGYIARKWLTGYSWPLLLQTNWRKLGRNNYFQIIVSSRKHILQLEEAVVCCIRICSSLSFSKCQLQL